MNFDPTIRLDFVATGLGLIFFVARLQNQVASNTRDINRTGKLLDDLEKRVRDTELHVASHLGAAAAKEDV